MYEIFRQRDARTILTVRWEWLARLITGYCRSLDYARPGEGWLDNRAD